MTWWKEVDVCYWVVKNFELSSEYFGRYCNNRLSLQQLKTYSWKLKIVYCKLKMYSQKLKMVYWKLKTIENELRSTGSNLVPLLATRCLYWCRQYIWAQVNWIQLSLTLATRCLYWGVHLSSGQPDPISYHSWPLDVSTGGYIWAQVNQTKLSTSLGH